MDELGLICDCTRVRVTVFCWCGGAGSACHDCRHFAGSRYKIMVLGIFLAVFAVLWYAAVGRPLLMADHGSHEAEPSEAEPGCYQRVDARMKALSRRIAAWYTGTSLISYLKVFISFWQVWPACAL